LPLEHRQPGEELSRGGQRDRHSDDKASARPARIQATSIFVLKATPTRQPASAVQATSAALERPQHGARRSDQGEDQERPGRFSR
jgi:hypothetical protein